MVEKQILKTIFFLQDLPEPMLEKISLNTQIQTFKAQTVLFEKDQALKRLYMLTSGGSFNYPYSFGTKFDSG